MQTDLMPYADAQKAQRVRRRAERARRHAFYDLRDMYPREYEILLAEWMTKLKLEEDKEN